MTQMLLYWDQVSSIVPYDYIMAPESLGPYMQSLVQEELVCQIMPADNISQIPHFDERFLGYLDSLELGLDRRRKNFASHNVLPIHIEKMSNIGETLVSLRLAQLKQRPWYDVESETADEFMFYLASKLSQLDSIDSSPVTDKSTRLYGLARAGVPQDRMAQQIDSLRIEVLDRVLPVSSSLIQPSELRAFKERHDVELGDFRRRVELELISVADIGDAALRQRRLEVFFDEAKVRISEIQAAMRGAGWQTARRGLSVITAIPGISPILGLAGAILEAATHRNQPQISRDFVYAAHASAELAGTV
ncbi:MAG: hypothetical protein QME41_05735 [Actinomycetota bacterium]|nr:hypothetical protein [Actinomycetota bacterium]